MCPRSRPGVCYKISILPLKQKEMLMRKKYSRQAVLWDLFRPTPERPIWSNLPLDVRQKTRQLLVRLLRAQQAQRRRAVHGKEVGDE
jgi:hypothetical protein